MHFAKMWQCATNPKIMMERAGKKIYAIFWHNATIFLHLERTIIKFSCYGNCCHTSFVAECSLADDRRRK